MSTNNTTVVINVDSAKRAKMAAFYDDCHLEGSAPGVLFRARTDGCFITVYCVPKGKEDISKAMFQGEEAVSEAMIWGYVPEEKKKATPLPLSEEIGSDEVGTGDFFGPVVVVAAHIPNDPSIREKIRALGVADSKTLTDEKIREIAPKLLKMVDYSCLILDNEKYNKAQEDGHNLNAIKAILHNRALWNVSSRHPKAKVYQDQFAGSSLYYSYLLDEENIVDNITFATKGESKFLSVALASVLARYAFLRTMDKLGETYGVSFPYGAGDHVTAFAARFAQTHGKEKLRLVAKLNFANYKRIED